MRKIELTRGKYALVDDADFEYLSQFKWCTSVGGYAVRKYKRSIIYMHRQIDKTPKGRMIDHINRDKLDNRRGNLRRADHRLNTINTGVRSNSSTGITGVSWDKGRNRWEAYISVNFKKKTLGRFTDKEKAVSARITAEKMYYA